MAKFLTTAGTSSEIEQVIIQATDQLILITPYLQLSPQSRERLQDANERDVKITLVYRDIKHLNKEDSKILHGLRNIELRVLSSLHAKCYCNGNKMILSSMNFYEFSKSNNREMGILLTKKGDLNAFNEAFEEVKSIIKASNSTKARDVYTEMAEPYQEQTTFHLPALQKNLQRMFPTWTIELHRRAISVVIPNTQIKLRMDHGLVVTFPNLYIAKNFKQKTPDDLLLDQNVDLTWGETQLAVNYKKRLKEYKMTNEDQSTIIKNYMSILEKLKFYLKD